MSLTRAERNRRYYYKHREEVIERVSNWQKKRRLEQPELAREQDKVKHQAQRDRGYKPPKYTRVKNDKTKAREVLNNAVKQGKITRPDYCSACLTDCVPHGHHEDYAKPLDVTWLCMDCHESLHHPVQALKDVVGILKERSDEAK